MDEFENVLSVDVLDSARSVLVHLFYGAVSVDAFDSALSVL